MNSSVPSACPSPHELGALVSGALNGSRQLELETHIGACPHCQAALDDATSGTADWELWDRLLAVPGRSAESTLRVHLTDAQSTGVASSLMPVPRPACQLTIPGYEILEELGRGGMGVVFKARETSLDRVVALKVLLPDYADHPEYLERFRREAQAAARLRHPNLVQIHAVGVHGGRSFLALEFVDGPTLKESLQEGTWSPVRAARLIVLLARAVHAVHTIGVVHRDLKPGNILLCKTSCPDDRGRGSSESPGTLESWIPKIADFGLAKNLNTGTDLTRSGFVAGTPGYMAPEQANGQSGGITPATDVYALGAVLYEMLTGRPPVKTADTVDALRQTVEDDPVPPCRLQPKLPRDLDTIVLKCLEKQPTRRFSSASDLADDLERYLRGEPITSRPPSVWERVWKAARRRPVAAVATAAGSLGVLVVLGVWLWLTAALRSEQVRTEARRAEAEQNYELAMAAVNDLVELSEDPDFEANGLEPLRRRLLTKARGFFVHFREDRADDPEHLKLRADALHHLARIDVRLGTPREALGGFEQAIGCYRRLLELQPDDPEYRYGMVMALRGEGDLLRQLSRFEQAREVLTECIDLCETEMRARPRDFRFATALVGAHFHLGWSYLNEARYDQADFHYARAIEIGTPLTEVTPREQYLWATLGSSNYQLGLSHFRRGRTDDALPYYEKSLEERRRALQLTPDNPRARFAVGLSMGGLAGVLRTKGELVESERIYQESLIMAEELARNHPAVVRYSHHLGWSYFGLARTYRSQGNLIRSEEMVRKSLAIRESVARTRPEFAEYVEAYFDSLSLLRSLLRLQGRHEELEALYRETEASYEWFVSQPGIAGKFLFRQASLLALFAQFLAESRLVEEALAVSDRAIRALLLYRDTVGKDDERVDSLLKNMRSKRADAMNTLGRFYEAEHERSLSLEGTEGVAAGN